MRHLIALAVALFACGGSPPEPRGPAEWDPNNPTAEQAHWKQRLDAVCGGFEHACEPEKAAAFCDTIERLVPNEDNYYCAQQCLECQSVPEQLCSSSNPPCWFESDVRYDYSREHCSLENC